MRAAAAVMASIVVAVLGATAADASAQGGTHLAEPATCYGFAFGRWHPDLDLAAAGHAPASSVEPTAPHGRSWAARDSSGPPAADSGQLMLMPPWWPAGVRLSAARLPGVGDTVRAVAVALVADGRATAPRSRALVWGKRCDEPVATAADSAPRAVAPAVRARDTARASRRPSPTRSRP